MTLPVDKVQSLIECLIGNVNFATARLKKIFLVEDLFDSLKFAAGIFYLHLLSLRLSVILFVL